MHPETTNPARSWRDRAWAVSVWSVAAAFGTYFCMYGFRKPFTAASYSGLEFIGLDYKSVLVIAQVFGYTVSKFLGIKFVSEMPPHRRAIAVVLLIGSAEAALILFACTPAPWNLIWLFVNGLPLGMVFGLVLGFLEGRRQSEALTAGLCASFIVADGVVKSVGAKLLNWGVAEFWMPAAAGAIFSVPLLGFVGMLRQIPPPSARDREARSLRPTMDAVRRGRFFRRYAPGVILLALAFLLVTILRSLRADFAPEIWRGLTAQVDAGVFARSETIVGFVVLALFAGTASLANHRLAFSSAMALAVSGSAMIGLSVLALSSGLPPFWFMVLVGLGLYLPYIAVHVTIFERLIAMTRDEANVGFLMYLVDSFGYLGYVSVLVARNFLAPSATFISLFLTLSVVISVACVLLLLPCWVYFLRHPAARQSMGMPQVDFVIDSTTVVASPGAGARS
ncbi:MAG: DUF5690 family protein [Gemmataceae bacterium]|nr:DUF5690 family protein [Gemmataceae bacterium]